MKACALVVLAVSACGASAAAPARPAAPPAGEALDVTPVRDRLRVYTDGQGHHLALVEPDPEAPAPAALTLFWAEGRTFHQVPVVSAFGEGLRFEIGFADARIPSLPAGSVKREEGKTVLSCWGTDVPLARVPAAEAKELLDGARFVKNRTRWSPVALGKDGDQYLYVDVGALPENHESYRVFTGKKGAMRAIDVVEARWDPRENALTIKTKDGTLRVTRDDSQKRSYTLKPAWEGRKPDWSSVERAENWRLIFTELGLYPEGRSPTPCDPMLAKP